MSARNLAGSLAVVAVILAVAGGLLYGLGFSDDADPVSSIDARPTSYLGKPSFAFDDALKQAEAIFTAAPPYIRHEIESVEYAETTVGEAKAVFDPRGQAKAWETREELEAWVFIAHGQFQSRAVPGSTEPGPTFDSVWVVVPKGGDQIFSGPGFQEYDLARLGSFSNVSLPLPSFEDSSDIETR